MPSKNPNGAEIQQTRSLSCLILRLKRQVQCEEQQEGPQHYHHMLHPPLKMTLTLHPFHTRNVKYNGGATEVILQYHQTLRLPRKKKHAQSTSHMRRTAMRRGIILQHHQKLRLPRKKQFILKSSSHMTGPVHCAQRQEAPSNITHKTWHSCNMYHHIVMKHSISNHR